MLYFWFSVVNNRLHKSQPGSFDIWKLIALHEREVALSELERLGQQDRFRNIGAPFLFLSRTSDPIGVHPDGNRHLWFVHCLLIIYKRIRIRFRVVVLFGKGKYIQTVSSLNNSWQSHSFLARSVRNASRRVFWSFPCWRVAESQQRFDENWFSLVVFVPFFFLLDNFVSFRKSSSCGSETGTDLNHNPLPWSLISGGPAKCYVSWFILFRLIVDKKHFQVEILSLCSDAMLWSELRFPWRLPARLGPGGETSEFFLLQSRSFMLGRVKLDPPSLN